MVFGRTALIAPLLILAACSSQPVGNNDIFSPIGGPASASARPSGDPYLTQGIGRLPPGALAQSTPEDAPKASTFENTVAAAIEQSEPPAPVIAAVEPQAPAVAAVTPPEPPAPDIATAETGAEPQPVQTAGVEPNADMLNLAETSQADQKLQRDVAARELQAAREQLVIVLPDAESTPSSEVNIAGFARRTKNQVGERIYKRSSGGFGSRCSRYASADDAQRAFLKSGGPQSDRLNLDRDGDGFACKWSPDLYRSLLVPDR